MKKYCFFLLLLFFSLQLSAQIEDNVAWLSIAAKGKVAKNTSWALMPTLRLNEDLSNYQNSSIDYAIKQQLGKGFSTQILGRTWFIPDNTIRQFLWIDIAYAKNLNKIKLSTSGRLHYAFDIDERTDADFLRWKSGITYIGWKKLHPFVNIEPWWRLDNDKGIQRIRYEPGIKYKASYNIDVLLMYRREDSLQLDPSFNINFLVATISYTFRKKIIIE